MQAIETAHDPAALIEAHLWIVDKFTATYAKKARNADIREAGALGLCEAAQRFEPRKGAQFATYAWNWVKGAVLAELRRCHVVPVSEYAVREANRRGEALRGVVVFGLPEIITGHEQESAADRAMRRRALEAAIEALDDPQQRAIVTLTLLGRTVEQIARELRRSPSHVAEQLDEACALLGELLEEEDACPSI